MRVCDVRGRPSDFEAFAETNDVPKPKLPRRVNLEPEKVEEGLVKLVLSLVELIRQLMEKQALRRIESGSLSVDEVERLGTALARLEQKMIELKAHFKIDSLNIDLGPLGNLFDEVNQHGTNTTKSYSRNQHE
ncbi:MAG: gas vesicle protein K [Deltaproteobacteria bacterium]|nr:gas vesicle protein K [Deltaproteobacteria bacterium]